jgi:hypothetical protein
MHRYDILYMKLFVLRKFLLRKCFFLEHLSICESLTSYNTAACSTTDVRGR